MLRVTDPSTFGGNHLFINLKLFLNANPKGKILSGEITLKILESPLKE